MDQVYSLSNYLFYVSDIAFHQWNAHISDEILEHVLGNTVQLIYYILPKNVMLTCLYLEHQSLALLCAEDMLIKNREIKNGSNTQNVFLFLRSVLNWSCV